MVEPNVPTEKKWGQEIDYKPTVIEILKEDRRLYENVRAAVDSLRYTVATDQANELADNLVRLTREHIATLAERAAQASDFATLDANGRVWLGSITDAAEAPIRPTDSHFLMGAPGENRDILTQFLEQLSPPGEIQ
jgi:hypothetical protein